MDAKTNSLLLQLQAKKEGELGWFEKEVRADLESLTNAIQQQNEQIKQLQESAQRCIGAMDQTISLYIKYIEMKQSNEPNEEDKKPDSKTKNNA